MYMTIDDAGKVAGGLRHCIRYLFCTKKCPMYALCREKNIHRVRRPDFIAEYAADLIEQLYADNKQQMLEITLLTKDRDEWKLRAQAEEG